MAFDPLHAGQKVLVWAGLTDVLCSACLQAGRTAHHVRSVWRQSDVLRAVSLISWFPLQHTCSSAGTRTRHTVPGNSLVHTATRHGLDGPGIEFWQDQEIFSSTKPPTSAPVPTQRLKRRGVGLMLTSHLHLFPRIWMGGAVPLLLYVFMEWTSATLYAFFWVIPRRLNFIRRRFETHCSIFIDR